MGMSWGSVKVNKKMYNETRGLVNKAVRHQIMETTLYAFVVAILIILTCFIALIIGLIKNWWRFILFCAAAGAIGGVTGYFIPSNETNIMVAKILGKEVMVELSIEQVHMVIGSAIGLLVVMFSTIVQSMRKRYVLKHAVPNRDREPL